MAQQKKTAKKNTASASGASSRKKTAAKAAPAKATRQGKPVRREVWAGVCLALGIFCTIGYFVKDYWLIDGLCLYVFKGLFGWGFLAVPVCFFWAAWVLAFHRGQPVTLRLVSIFLIPLLFGAVVHLLVVRNAGSLSDISVRSLYISGKNMESGGVVSGVLADVLRSAVSVYGSLPILLIALIAAVFSGARISPRSIISEWRNRERPQYEPEEPAYAEPVPVKASTARGGNTLPPSAIYENNGLEPVRGGAPAQKQKPKKPRAIDIKLDEDTDLGNSGEPEIPDMPRGPVYIPRPVKPIEPVRNRGKSPAAQAAEQKDDGLTSPFVKDERSAAPAAAPVSRTPDPLPAAPAAPEPVKVPEKPKAPEEKPKEIEAAAVQIAAEIENAPGPKEYRYPPLDLLQKGSGVTSDGRDEVSVNRERLETCLRSFGVAASVSGYTRGPTVTRFDLELEPGVKLSRITNLAGDLALQLGVASVRIAPIPDKISTVGVEVPNRSVSMVLLRDVLESPAFQNASSKLTFAIGKDIGGNCIVGNIAKLPHMLIAGTTGSGKSVCMNSLILSLLYKSTPDEVRLIMIDPKMVELGIYNGIPHLYVPVVTDPKKAAGSLQWAVVEMMKRYSQFSGVGVRDISGYNAYLKRNDQPRIPNIVIVIDELADLMMTAAKEVEESVCRLAQMGRAAGMHLVIATQRPSSDVITGLMKANIPSRIAFAVSSGLESRIILDQQGAEKLVGHGDMLYAPLGCGKPVRVQGTFVSDEEREDVINYIKEGSQADYNDEILKAIEEASKQKENSQEEKEPAELSDENPFGDYDDLLPQAVEVLLDTKQGSVSMLQRRLKLGYSRAARLMDQMEELGIVGPFEGSKARAVLVTREQWQEMSMSGTSAVEQLINEQKDDYSGGKL